MILKPSPVQRDIVQSEGAGWLNFVGFGESRFRKRAGPAMVWVEPASRRLWLMFSISKAAGKLPALQKRGISCPGQEMKKETFIRRSRINASAAEVYAWHSLPGALELLTPPGERLKVIERTGGVESGARVVLQFGRWPFRRRWVAQHGEFEEGRYFSDVQISGPFAYWKHTHTFQPDGPAASVLEDRVEYALPFGVLGRWFAGRYARRKLGRLFEYRHEVTAREVTNKKAPA